MEKYSNKYNIAKLLLLSEMLWCVENPQQAMVEDEEDEEDEDGIFA